MIRRPPVVPRFASGFPRIMTFSCHTISLLAAGLCLAAVSCVPGQPPPPPPRANLALCDWFDDQGPGEVAMTIRLSTQTAEVTRGGRLIGWTYVATGREGFGTRPGNYRITEKVVDKISNRYGWTEDEFGNKINPAARFDDPVPPGQKYVPAPMPYWMRLTDYGIGMHAGPIPQPGQTASHGCIRLPDDFAVALYEVAKLGTPVKIIR
jgi:lipoprotein-anchoring transpeptidase ErfK/SrfK